MDEVAYFDVIPAVDIAEFAGTWSNYRFPGSGNVVVSTIENAVNGLMVLRPTLDGEPPVSGGPVITAKRPSTPIHRPSRSRRSARPRSARRRRPRARPSASASAASARNSAAAERAALESLPQHHKGRRQ
jgi:hypothetical protein